MGRRGEQSALRVPTTP